MRSVSRVEALVLSLIVLSSQNRVPRVDAFGSYHMSVASVSGKTVRANGLQHAHQLRTSFIALRHGQSLANEQGIISSRPDVSTIEHGLTNEGKKQAKAAGIQILEKLNSYKESSPDKFRGVAILSSDYMRAKETAEIVASCVEQHSAFPLFQNQVIFDERLRERGFGDLHATSDTNYQKVWTVDAKDPNHTEWNVESINSVLQRTTDLVRELEDKTLYDPSDKSAFWVCVLVAHGDVLQILQTAFANINVKQHRSLLHLKTGVPRDLILTTDQDQVG